jgi:HD-GYP domain-containing protein (c-di-GMP phosphodiesterase class II)
LLAAYALGDEKDRATVMGYGLAGLLHDVGKAMLPVSLLNARRKLNENEQRLVRLHPLLAYEFLSSFADIRRNVLRAVLEHHERYDGSGYPRGISADKISEIGQLAGIADTYDALSSQRPFQNAVNPHKSLGLMYRMRKKDFHPLLVEKFVRLMGIYPVGSVVELKDGYKGVVSAGNPNNPMKPSVILVRDPQGKSMRLHECDLAKGAAADISHYIPVELSGIDPCLTLGL